MQRKRARTKKTRETTGDDELSFAAHMKLRERGRHQAATVVQKAVESSPRTLSMIYAFIKDQGILGHVAKGKPIPFTVEAALANKIQSKDQYIYNRTSLQLHNCNVFPSYDRIAAYKVIKIQKHFRTCVAITEFCQIARPISSGRGKN